MIQRIQTLFLLLAAGCISAMFCFNIASFVDGNGAVYELIFNKLQIIENGKAVVMQNLLTLTIALCITVLALMVTVFLYKKRQLQMRICRLIIIMLVLIEGILVYYFFLIKGNLTGCIASPGLSFILPIIAGIFTYLAHWSINKDDILVRSFSRIR
jgi:hypothetical protein